MQGQSATSQLAGLVFTLLALTVSACQTGLEARPVNGLNGNREYAQAERLAREEQYAAAAQMYEDMARQDADNVRGRLFVRAAREWLRANDLPRAESALREAGSTLPAADSALYGLVAARVALLRGAPGQALDYLDRIPQPWPRDEAPAILEVRAQALFADGKPAGAVAAAVDRERLLNNSAEILRNRRMIWDGVQQNAARGVSMLAPSGSSRVIAGWLDIGAAALAVARNPFQAQAAVDAWRSNYPEHPGNELLAQQVLPQLRAAVTFPAQIALLLPLSGAQQMYGEVVRDGFMAAVLQQPADKRPLIRVYDSATGIGAAYAQAVADGARFIVGPLTKPEVAALATSQQVTIPTLALNELPEQTAPIPNLFRFWLDPTEEARLVAQRIAAEGLTHGIALLPRSDWGERVYRAFSEELTSRGGTVVGREFYDRTKRDFREPVTAALLIDESNARAAALSRALGTRLEFEPRARSDVQFIFLGAEPVQGRLLRPTIRFHLLDPVPIFATSDIYEPDAAANADIDDVAFPDMPWLIAPDSDAVQLRAALNRYWPTRARERGRLYALGYDSFRLVPLLVSQSEGLGGGFANGMTGRLFIDGTGRVRRDLDWARIVNGRPQALGAPTVVAAPIGVR